MKWLISEIKYDSHAISILQVNVIVLYKNKEHNGTKSNRNLMERNIINWRQFEDLINLLI